jgi:hypothetical protein
MRIEAISNDRITMVQQTAAVNILKKAMDTQQQAALQLLESLPKIKDDSLGRYIDTYA